MNSFKGNISFFKGWLNFSSLKVLELLPAKARHNFFEILKLYIKLYIVHIINQYPRWHYLLSQITYRDSPQQPSPHLPALS